MGLVVTGISQHGDIKALEESLKDAGLPLDPIQLISGEDSTEGVARRQVGPRIMTGDHAGYVPGINNSGMGLSYFGMSRCPTGWAISRFPIRKSRTTLRPSNPDAAWSPISPSPTAWRRSRRSSATAG